MSKVIASPSFEFNDLRLRRSSGKEYTICPVCSQHRKKKTAPCVTVNHESGKANCHHCGAWGVRELSSKHRTLVDPASLPYLRSPSVSPVRAYIPKEVVQRAVRGYEINSLFTALEGRGYAPEKLTELFESFQIGTASDGRVIFPMIDIDGMVRAIQTKKFDDHVKTVEGSTGFAHHELAKSMRQRGESVEWYTRYTNNTPPFGLFGAHRLGDDMTATVHLVEAPKTAVIASLELGGLWCATISKGGLSAPNCADLKGRTVVIWADADAVDEWKAKADQVAREVGFTCSFSGWESNFQDIGATDDIADMILKRAKPSSASKPMTEAEIMLQKWSGVNPALEELCDRLGLVPVGWSMP